MALDHGILNTPLSKRGITDAEIDRNLAAQNAAAEALYRGARDRFRTRVREALATLALIPDSRIANMGAKHGLTVKQTRERLADIARTRPEMAIAAFSRDVSSEAQA